MILFCLLIAWYCVHGLLEPLLRQDTVCMNISGVFDEHIEQFQIPSAAFANSLEQLKENLISHHLPIFATPLK